MDIIRVIGIISAIVMPLWNIPLIVKIYKRRSAKDISLLWVIGVWVCIMGMLPSAWRSPDPIFKSFSILNSILFSLVLIVTLKYRSKE